MRNSGIIEFEERFGIHAPVNAVERLLTDALAMPQWRAGMRRNWEASTAVMQPGTTLHFVTRQFGANFEYIQIVSQYLPGRRLAYRTTKGVFFVDTAYEWGEDRGGTRLLGHYRMRIPQNKQFMAPLVERLFRRQVRRDHRKLKHLLETGTQRYLAPSDLTTDEPRSESMQSACD